MSITLLEYFKMILTKVSFDAKLFEKELKKALKELIKTDLLAFKKWCYTQFGNSYSQIIKSAFSTITFRKSKKSVIIEKI